LLHLLMKVLFLGPAALLIPKNEKEY